METDLNRLAHYGYEIRPDGAHWTFSPNGRGALYGSRDEAVRRAVSALNVELERAALLMTLKAREPVTA